ncbi:MAG TPA: GNAT family protein [Haliangiales bacterium]|nr:GNAT family protein [Haliangiales bacterium]
MSLVRLRPLSLDDVDRMMDWVNDPDIVGNIAAFAGKPLARDDEEAYVRRLLASDADKVFAIERAADGAYLGNVGIHQIFWRSRVGRLACIIGYRAEMGKGYGSAAIAGALDWAFGEAKLHKVWLMVFSSNARARRTYARLGFIEEGVLREEYFHEGGWHDMVRMSVLDREWA